MSNEKYKAFKLTTLCKASGVSYKKLSDAVSMKSVERLSEEEKDKVYKEAYDALESFDKFLRP
jgi:hypothetical protein